jgi:hypothetical protein
VADYSIFTENFDKDDGETVINEKCHAVDSSSIGLIYFLVPSRMHIINTNMPNSYSTFYSAPKNVFKLNNYYSLLMLVKLFNVKSDNPILFYYLNETYGVPASTHYNQWLNDSFWMGKIPAGAVKFVPYSNPSLTGYSNETGRIKYDMHGILSDVKRHAMTQFRNVKLKDKFMLVTSDVIIGPRLLQCFSKDSTVNFNPSYSDFDADAARNKLASRCHDILNNHENNPNVKSYVSVLYKMEHFHVLGDFSGALLWNREFIREKITPEMVKSEHVYYCHYKSDILDSLKYDYANSVCIFGFELNLHDAPNLEMIFFNRDNYFSKTIRHFLYGSTKTVEYKKLDTEKIPNVVHLIWFGEFYKTMKFIEYLCVKSILRVINPDKIRIHGDVKPFSDEYWDELSANPRVEWVQMERPLSRYGQNFSGSPIQHVADVARLEVLYNEGGIYSDFDIIWVKPLDKFRYLDVDLIASNDITSYCNEFPNSVQIGAFLAPPKSPFLLKWLQGYEKYHLFPGDYVAVSMCEPYKVYEKEPGRVYIDNRLQMIYFNGWSAFIPRYTAVNQEDLQDFNNKLDWKNDGTYGYHLPRHGDLYSKDNYNKSDKSTLPIKIATYILNL